ncbi:TrkH family potassium uptake protein, partial [bacterium]|nr:TrkH family potassium uptake protein [bacterium]
MNYKAITRTLSFLLLIISIFMMIPLGVAVIYGEQHALFSFALPIILSVVILLPTAYLLRNVSMRLSTRDGFLVVTLSWIAASFFGSLPFVLSGAIPHFTDAFFETMSGFTTTGASILTNIEAVPKSILFWRSLTHWLGGMGIVVLTVAVLPILGIGGLQLLKAEAPGPTVDKITPRIAETAKVLWYIYLGMTVVETGLLMIGGMSLFDGLTHTFGTLATGGFSTRNSSVGAYNSAYIDAVITFFMVLAGMNFSLHFRFLTGNFKKLAVDTEMKVYLAIFAIATILISFSLYGKVYDSFATALRYASFQVASILTTTGYATTNFELWPPFAIIILFILMFIGGSSGSTGGGIKVVRIVTLFKQGINEMLYLIHPRGVFTLRLSGQPIKKDMVYAVSGFFMLYLLMLLTVTLIVAAAGYDITTSLTTALATVGNIGPG